MSFPSSENARQEAINLINKEKENIERKMGYWSQQELNLMDQKYVSGNVQKMNEDFLKLENERVKNWNKQQLLAKLEEGERRLDFLINLTKQIKQHVDAVVLK